MENFGVPIEIFLKIVKLLPSHQLMACKAVCRSWYSIISDGIQFKKLVLSTTSHFNRRWYLSYEFASPSDLIKIDNFNQPNLNQTNFDRLKALFLYSEYECHWIPSKFSIGNLVNHMKQLEQLEMVGLVNDAENDCIAVKSLRTLHIGQCSWNDLVVECPNLSNLKMIGDFHYDPDFSAYNQKIEFKHPESVRSLEVVRLRSEWVAKFKNLERLSLDWIYSTRSNFLSELPHLKEYAFNGDPGDTYDVLVRMKHRLNRVDLKLYPAGFLFGDEILPDEFDCYFYLHNTVHLVPFIKTHLSEFVARDQTYLTHFCYNLFASCFTGGLPDELLKRLVAVRNLEANGQVNDADQLTKVLDYLGRSLDQIKIKSSLLGQEFFDELPKRCPILSVLIIKGANQIDPAFILKFQSLKQVEYHQELDAQIARASFVKYKYLSSFLFYHQDHCFELCRSPKNRSQLVIADATDQSCKKKKKIVKNKIRDLSSKINLILD